MEAVGGLLILLVLILLYLLPAIVAAKRNHHQFGAITLLNILLGWTTIGWIVALIWSFSAVRQQKEQVVVVNNMAEPKTLAEDDRAVDKKECPSCAEMVKAKAKKCRFCGYEFDDLVKAADESVEQIMDEIKKEATAKIG